MKWLKKSRWLLALLVLLVPAVALAATGRTDENAVSVRQDVVINDDLYAASENINVTGTVNGSVFAAAGTVTIDGTVTGDVWVGAGTVNITGTVGGAVRVAAGTVSITGKVGTDVLAAGGDVRISRGSTVGRDVLVTSGTLVLDGSVGRNVKSDAGEVTVGGAIAGELKTSSGELQLIEGASVGGAIRYRSSQELQRAPNTTVGGPIERTAEDKPAARDDGGFAERALFQVVLFAMAAVLLLVGLLFFRRGLMAGGEQVIRRPGWAALAGLVTIIATPVVCFMLLLTLVGIPLSVLLFLKYLVVMYLAKLFVAMGIGQLILRRRQDHFWHAFGVGLLGLAIYYALTLIPIIGWLLTMVTVILGTGAQVLLAAQIWRDSRAKYGS